MHPPGPAGPPPPSPHLAVPRAEIPLQGDLVAIQCPVRAQHDADRRLPAQPLPASDAAQLRSVEAVEFRQEMFELLRSGPAGDVVVAISGGTVAERQAATREAVAAGRAVILDAWLPDDPLARRNGPVDVLVRVGNPSAGGGYVPVEIRHHTLARLERSPGGTARWSPVGQPDPQAAADLDHVELSRRYHHDDGFRLAHAWRLLEACGWAPDPAVQAPIGGVIDKQRRIWWLDLAAPVWPRWWHDDVVSLLHGYDDEFALRLQVIAHQLDRNDHPDRLPLVTPSRIPECDTCPWRGVCLPRLEAADHVSMLPRTTWRNVVTQARHGITTRRQLAALHWPTAWAAQGDVGNDPAFALQPLLTGAEALADQPAELLDRLAELHITTDADVAALDPATAAVAGRDAGHLPTLIDQARAIVSQQPFRARGVDQVTARRADIEIDLDMENMPEGVYLWGALTTVRSPEAGDAFHPGYRPFVYWADAGETGVVTPQAEQALLAEVVRWLHDAVGEATARGLTIGIYSWSRAEENSMRRIARDADDPAFPGGLVDELLSSPHWIDLLPVFATQIITGRGNGLKVVAPLAGFAWRDDDPGGEQSQVWYRHAVSDPDPATRAAFRDRILTYNEDDVRATLAVRAWLDGPGQDLPSVAAWEPPG